MGRSQLPPQSITKLFHLLNNALRTAPLPKPVRGEDEETYTNGHLLPVIKETVDRTNVSGLIVGGHHTGVNRSVRYLSLDFVPDVLVVHHGDRLIAYEVKILGGGDRSGALSKAVGQATIYGLRSFAASAALILDSLGRVTPSQLAQLGGADHPTRFATIVRSAQGGLFRPGSLSYAKR
jgi:hypothetical protein